MNVEESDDKNEVIIIGGYHHNTLSVIRAFGKAGCDIYALIHVNYSKNNWVTASKYIKNNFSYIDSSEKAILDWLIDNKKSDKKCIIFPCSDLAAYTIDNNWEKLTQNYFLQGFNGRPGLVVWFMDKYNQYKFACDNNILMAKTWICEVDKCNTEINNDIFPCILKPIISVNGKKEDISIANNLEEYREKMNSLINKGYRLVLVQEFIEKDYEVCAFGCIISQEPKYIGCILKKLRIYPKDRGSLTYAKSIKEEKIQQFLDNILKILYDLGYRGAYDIELLIKSDHIYLNEINFRHSGNGAFLIENGINVPYYLALDIIKKQIGDSVHSIKENEYFMNIYMDFRFRGTLSVVEWLSCLKRTHTYTIWTVTDMKPSFVYGGMIAKRGISKIMRKIKRPIEPKNENLI